MNDLPHCIENGHVTMFADDTSTSCEVKSVHDITVKVIPDLVKLCDWLKSNKLSLNMIKTEFMIIGSTQNVLKFGDLIATRIDDQLIKQVAYVKYLGIIVDDRLTWKEHVDYISKKISPNIGAIKRSRQCITVDPTIALYRTLIEPYLKYCCNVWKAVAMLYYIDFKPYKIEPFVSSLTPVTKMLITSYFSNVLISCLLNKLFNLITYV